MEQFASWELAQKANAWAGRNKTRWRDADYDRLWRAAEREMDPVKRAALFIRMNDFVVQNGVVIPIVARNGANAVSNRLRGVDFSSWSGTLCKLAYWYREV
jgi:peptide/nickel transport system substrate-binding protein